MPLQRISRSESKRVLLGAVCDELTPASIAAGQLGPLVVHEGDLEVSFSHSHRASAVSKYDYEEAKPDSRCAKSDQTLQQPRRAWAAIRELSHTMATSVAAPVAESALRSSAPVSDERPSQSLSPATLAEPGSTACDPGSCSFEEKARTPCSFPSEVPFQLMSRNGRGTSEVPARPSNHRAGPDLRARPRAIFY